MVRSILVGLDGSDFSKSAVEMGIALSRRTGALLVGLGIVDEPTIRELEPSLIAGGVPYAEPMLFRERVDHARREVEGFLADFSVRCARAGVPCKLLEDRGYPDERIELESQRYDLILLGRQSRFRFETQEGYDDTTNRILKTSPRPVIVVPADLPVVPDEPGRPVLVAYDGSVQASRALHEFRTSGLAASSPVVVASVHVDAVEAARIAERAIDYLRFHDVKAEAQPIASRLPASRLLVSECELRGAWMIVMGCYGQSGFREFFLGSVTRNLLRESPVPLFLFH
ncbi:Universal stress protein family protein [Aquisphaera giovannonii]|uniref:Universal stress protein family protein n=1 Tax=Aquisphaera giovannonii TaxID=406548 RepID=A0A5B9VW36_9BACT|nr:universal stress protein [Aquisphaera giovannonii]QEH32676.1 Universal stress protein family protein [Aquisphaera giovannonii]